jgi:hypothetical protein
MTYSPSQCAPCALASPRNCCGEPLDLIREARHGELAWRIWECHVCGTRYSIGPKPPPTWIDAVARVFRSLYDEVHAPEQPG